MALIPGFLPDPVGLLASPLFTLLLAIVILPLAARYLHPDQQPPLRAHNAMIPLPRVINRRGGFRIPVVPRGPDGEQGEEPESPATPASERAEFDASRADVATVRADLMARGKLPIEIANLILDKAEYWACSTTTADYSSLPRKSLDIRGGSDKENEFLLRSKPLALAWSPCNDEAWRNQAAPRPLREEYPKERLEDFMDEPKATIVHPARKVVFNITSCDQGWGGDHNEHGTYNGSWTWFDAGLERFDAKAECVEDCPGKARETEKPDLCTCALRPIWPPIETFGDDEANTRYSHELGPAPDHKIQCNKLAVQGMQRHKVEWRHNDNIHPDSADAAQLEQAGRGRATGDGEFVRNLRIGDVITVWGRARFGGWQNRIKKVEVKVYWAL